MKKIKFLVIMAATTVLWSCNSKEKASDAYGNFEATKTIISAEGSGKILEFTVEEGQQLDSGMLVGQIDTLDLFYKKSQLESQILSLQSNISSIESQKAVSEQQKDNLLIDKKRIEQLYKSNAATQKQVDDINGAINLSDKQIAATETQKSNILNQIAALENQKKSLELSIKKCKVINPFKGVVLSKLAYTNEMTMSGKTLYTLADLSNLELKVYVSGDMLSRVKLGQEVKVLIDKDKKENSSLSGKVSWISENAEFTPKTIQTKEERVNYVYAVKIKVENKDGLLKIGMPGEVNF